MIRGRAFYRGRGVYSLVKLDVLSPVHRDIAAGFSDIIDNMRLVRHIPLSERDHVLQVVCQEFPANVYSFDMLPDNLSVLDWDDMAERVPDIEHDTACRWYVTIVTEESAVRDERGSFMVSDPVLIQTEYSRVLRK
jgi:hypothetical protein